MARRVFPDTNRHKKAFKLFKKILQDKNCPDAPEPEV
jgi:hypothetical protein